MRSRNAHRTDQGTTLIAVEAEGKLIEVDQVRDIVWQWQAPNGKNRKLYMGRRLAKGNTVASLSDPGEVVEVDRSGKIGALDRRNGPGHPDGMGVRLCVSAGRRNADQRLHRPADHQGRREGQSGQPMAHRLADYRKHRRRPIGRYRVISVLSAPYETPPLPHFPALDAHSRSAGECADRSARRAAAPSRAARGAEARSGDRRSVRAAAHPAGRRGGAALSARLAVPQGGRASARPSTTT